MDSRVEEFVERARDRHGLEIDVRVFPDGTATAADAADAVGCDVAQIASSLVFVATGASETPRADGKAVDDGDPVVVITSGANRASEDRLADALDADDVRMADPDEVRRATGWDVGGVPPICHESDLRVLLDDTLLRHDTVWAAAGSPEAVWPVDPDRLATIADAEPSAVSG